MLQGPLKCCVSLVFQSDLDVGYVSSSYPKKCGVDLAEHAFLPAKQKRFLCL